MSDLSVENVQDVMEVQALLSAEVPGASPNLIFALVSWKNGYNAKPSPTPAPAPAPKAATKAQAPVPADDEEKF